MSKTITQRSQQSETDMRKLYYSVAGHLVRFSAFTFAIACFHSTASGQDESSLPEVEVQLENPVETPKSTDEDDYSWFGTIMTFPADKETEPFRFSSHSKPAGSEDSAAFVEGKIEPAGRPWNKNDQPVRFAIGKDSEISIKLSEASSTALTEGTDFIIEIENLSSKIQKLPTVGLQLPDSMTLISANRAPQVDYANRIVFFTVNELAPNARDSISYRVRTTVAGSLKQNVTVSPANRPRIQVELKTNFENK